MNLCKDCKHFESAENETNIPDYAAPPMPHGHCRRWLAGYHHSYASMDLNEAWIMDDYGRGNVVGPDFGCVLWEGVE